MIEAPVLKLLDFTNSFLIQTDASGMGMSVVLIQNGHPVELISKRFCLKLQGSSTYVRESHADTMTVV